GSGVLEIGNSLRLDPNEVITNTNTTLFINNDNNGDVQFDGNSLYVDASANNVGVRTTLPLSEFTISNGGAGDVTQTWTVGATTWYAAIDDSDVDKLQIGTGTTPTSNESMTFQTDGNVGIGTTAPSTQLHVDGVAGRDAFRVQTNGATKVFVESDGDIAMASFFTPTYDHEVRSDGVDIISRTINTNATGTGILGVGNNLAGTFLAGGSGVTGQGTNVGIFGTATTAGGSGVYGSIGQADGFGIDGFNTNTSGTGIIGTGNNQTGTYLVSGTGGAFTGQRIGIYGKVGADSITAGVLRAGGYFYSNLSSYVYVGAVTTAGVNRKIEGNGTVNTIVKDLNNNLVVMSASEAPENLFEDYGKGQLSNGTAHIDLDPIFSKNIVVNNDHPLRVFIQLEGDCNGVYVADKSANGFDVTELKKGKSNTKFMWHVVANRADEVLHDGSVSRYSSERFAPAIGPQPYHHVKRGDEWQIHKSELPKEEKEERK
ncbi:hypothetical protein JYU20_04840, partial [Bacteroidales bacterium AH-315-I05]|nr:hypothetical protein [Bacteroidales bacterium AH-315-I05]